MRTSLGQVAQLSETVKWKHTEFGFGYLAVLLGRQMLIIHIIKKNIKQSSGLHLTKAGSSVYQRAEIKKKKKGKKTPNLSGFLFFKRNGRGFVNIRQK